MHDAIAVYRKETAGGAQDIVMLIGDSRVPCLEYWRSTSPADGYRFTVDGKDIPTIIRPIPRHVAATSFAQSTDPRIGDQLASPAADGAFWALGMTALGGSLIAVDKSEIAGNESVA